MQAPPPYTCPRCHAPIHAGQRACTQCGLALDPQSLAAYEAQQAAQPAAPAPAPPAYPAAIPAGYAAAAPPRKRPGWLIPVIGGAVGLCVLCGIFLLVARSLVTPVPVTVTPPTPVVQQAPGVAATMTLPDSGGAAGQPQGNGGMALAVNKVSTVDTIQGLSPATAGNVFLVVDVTVLDQSVDNGPYNPLYFSLKDSDGFEYQPAMAAPPPALQAGYLAAGDKARGNVAFEIPPAAHGFVLTFAPDTLFGTVNPIQVRLGR